MKKTIIKFKEGIVAGHQEPLIGAQFNSQFNQVVSLDPNCVVVWDPSDGHMAFRFEHEDAITCHSFDVFQRRLVTGHVNGEIRVWNYINGQVLQVCTYEKHYEFTKVIHVDIHDGSDDKFIVGATWDRKIRWWLDSESLNEKPDPHKRVFEQGSDIVSLAYLPPHSIVSGSDCGDIIFFKVNSGNVDIYIRMSLFPLFSLLYVYMMDDCN
jgi:WD40 repeat protein